ncbi:MAG: hypothetical protein PVG39_00750 [Desulfobacteraceae bacterium]
MKKQNQTKKRTIMKQKVSGAEAAKNLFSQFMKLAFQPIVRMSKQSKSMQRRNYIPHQGKQEKARRVRQLRDGIIHNTVSL